MEREFREFLRRKGLRLTPERQAMVRALSLKKGHFDPDGLYLDLKKKGKPVSRASVYRTLSLLRECGLIEEVERTDKHAHYERVHGREHHDHMLCLGCGKVIEFYSVELEELQAKLCIEQRFDTVSHSLEIKGYCVACRDKYKQ